MPPAKDKSLTDAEAAAEQAAAEEAARVAAEEEAAQAAQLEAEQKAAEEEAARVAAEEEAAQAAQLEAEQEAAKAAAELAAEQKALAALKATKPAKLDEPPHPAVDEAALLAAGYHPPSIAATMADVDERVGFKVADPADKATHVSFEDGSTHVIDPKSGRISGVA